MDGLLINEVNKIYPDGTKHGFHALQDINISLAKGENLAIEGESGSGKSTLARLMLGIEKPTGGAILIDGEDITGWNYSTWKKHRKKIQAVFQDSTGTLNPARTAYQNVEEALVNLTHYGRRERSERINTLMDIVKMKRSLLDTPVRQLSGGEQRRLALIRAMLVQPDYLVLDEVTSGLDLISADAVLTLIEDSTRLHNCSCIFITHNQEYAMRIASRIIIMKNGTIVRRGNLIK